MDEFSLIEKYFAPLAAKPGALGLKDDAALLDVPAGHQLVVTADAISAGVHFIGDETPDLIARKLLRVNLSDLAAKGAIPLGFLLTLALPEQTDEAWIAQFASGLKEDCEEYAISLLGGDTIRTKGPLTCSLTALGSVERGSALLRSGAKAGDGIYVSGTLGDGALGLKVARKELAVLDETDRQYLLSRYRLPVPRLAFGQRLIPIASASMDISDGLMQDLGHICKASKLGAEIYFDQLPLSDAARACANEKDFITSIVSGGDDYELLFTVPPEREAALKKHSSIPFTRIGQMLPGGSVSLFKKRGGALMPLSRQGYSHF